MSVNPGNFFDRFIERHGHEPQIALVPRGGPENGPFSAMAARILNEVLSEHGHKISAIYPSSGSTPTAILGCTGDYAKLCDTWVNMTPEQIVGKINRLETIYRVIRKESLLSSDVLKNLIRNNWDLERIFSPEAIAIKFQAVDIFSRELITFSNKDPRHKPHLLSGVLGAMAIVPFLEPQVIFNPQGCGLIDEDKIQNDALFLVDGGYRSNMMLEMAMRDGFDLIFVIDVHGLKPTENKFTFNDLNGKFPWAKLLRNCFHLLSNANDDKQYQLASRVNEEIDVRDELIEIIGFLEQFPDYPVNKVIDVRLRTIIERMNSDRLRLADKKHAEIIMISNEEYSTLFNFAKFKPNEPRELLNAGWLAAVETLDSMGFDTGSVKPGKRTYFKNPAHK